MDMRRGTWQLAWLSGRLVYLRYLGYIFRVISISDSNLQTSITQTQSSKRLFFLWNLVVSPDGSYCQWIDQILNYFFWSHIQMWNILQKSEPKTSIAFFPVYIHIASFKLFLYLSSVEFKCPCFSLSEPQHLRKTHQCPQHDDVIRRERQPPDLSIDGSVVPQNLK